jgi:hypothetical protein
MKRLALALVVTLSIGTIVHAQPLPADVCATVRQVRGAGAIASNAQIGEMLNRIAWTHRAQGIGLSQKPGGNRCPSLAGEIACDILMLENGTAWDVFRSAEPGEPTAPQCGSAIQITDPDRGWIAPVEPRGVEEPPPPPPPGDVALATVLEKLEALARDVALLRDNQAADAVQLRADVAELREQLLLLSSHPVVLPPWPVYQGKVLGQTITLRPVK